MDRLALIGLAIAATGAAAFASSELIGTAYAGRPADRSYLMALSSGSSLQLMPRGLVPAQRVVPLASVQIEQRRMSCSRIVEVSSVSLGFRCQEQ